jgi:hypothetical protein
MLESLVSSRRLLERPEDKVIFKFFLGQEFRAPALNIAWIKDEWSKRVYQLIWPEEELRTLLQERLGLASDGRCNSLGQLSEVDNLDDLVIKLSMGSPRELIVICNRLFNEHSSRWTADEGDNLFITREEVNEVLRPFEEQYRESALEQLIAQGESERLEFKSSMRYNLRADKFDKEMEREIARTLCGFMNTEGGTLIIGLDDGGKVLGLDKDFSTLGKKQNRDGFELAFANLLKDLLDPSILQGYYSTHFELYQNKDIYVVDIERSKELVYCRFDDNREFYIRELTRTRKLDVKETVEYIRSSFRSVSG